MSVCAADDCQVEDSVAGYCGRHYQRVQAHGDPYIGRYDCKDCGREYRAPIEDKAGLKGRCYKCRHRLCRFCSRLFVPIKYAADQYLYCSYYCHNTSRSLRSMEKRTSTCEGCGESFVASRTDRTTYCSRECAYDNWEDWNPGVARREIQCACCDTRLLRVEAHTTAYCSPECAERGREWECVECGLTFHSRGQASYCSESCRKRSRWTSGEVECAECGEVKWFETHANVRRFCSKTCGKRFARRQRKAAEKASHVEDVSLGDIYRRDGAKCGICGERVPRGKYVPHPKAATIDHIVPLAAGGTHEPKNVQLAHFVCNSRKSDRAAGSQLRLVG